MTRRNFALKSASIIMIVGALFYYNQIMSLAAELSKANEEIEKVIVIQKELASQNTTQEAEGNSEIKNNENNDGEIEEAEETTLEEKAKYKAGVYEGVGQGYGGEIVVQITLGDSEIEDIEVIVADNEDAAYYNMAIDIITEIVETQSAEVDVVSGATYTSNGIIEAVENALSKAVN